jgi:predicted RecB family nuclease
MQHIDGAPVYSATDLVGFLACGHRFELERAALAGLVKKPVRSDPTIDLLRERGFEHERQFLADLEAAGRTVVQIERDGSAVDPADRDPGRELREAADETVRAMEARADVIYQATFFVGTWRGHADFLLRVDHGPGAPDGRLGAWHYEVVDTKLARHVAAGAVLQICSYVDQLTRIQGCDPESLHVVLGGSARERVTLRVADYMAYYRRVKADFLAAADEAVVGPAAYPPARTYPEPVEHCDVCRWWATCRDRRRADDDLSLVAGIGGRQRAALKARPADVPPGPIATRRGLARLELPVRPRLDGTSDEALSRVREQARIQVEGEDRGEMLWELLEPARAADPGTGESPTAASWSCRSRRRATSSSTSRATRSPSRTGSTTCSASSSLPSRRPAHAGRARRARASPSRRRRSRCSTRSGASTPKGP